MIEIKEYNKKYEKDLVKIISDTWNYETLCSRKTCYSVAKTYLMSCLSIQSFNYVVIEDGKCKGIIIGKCHKGKLNFKYRFKYFISGFKLLFNRESRIITNVLKTVNEVDEKFMKDKKDNYEAEVCYFVLDSSLRSKGVGKQLLNLFKERIKENNCVNYYLFTDSSCNFNFYIHNNLIIKDKTETMLDLNGYKTPLELYLFEGHIE